MHVLNAMHRPENLFDAVENDAIARFFARVICGEAAVVGRVPIFGRDHEIKVSLQFICKRDDLITMRHCQRASRQKIILKIDED
jgi:cystathionine beta-lyase family protein involved in aluminum resistance